MMTQTRPSRVAGDIKPFPPKTISTADRFPVYQISAAGLPLSGAVLSSINGDESSFVKGITFFIRLFPFKPFLLLNSNGRTRQRPIDL